MEYAIKTLKSPKYGNLKCLYEQVNLDLCTIFFSILEAVLIKQAVHVKMLFCACVKVHRRKKISKCALIIGSAR